MTTQEFKELKAKYWETEYAGKYIIITRYFPERLLILCPYKHSMFEVRPQIIEISKDDILYYGCSGRKIKESFIAYTYIQSRNFIIENDKRRDYLEFFTQGYDPTMFFIDLSSLNYIFKPKFIEFINDLKRNQISISGLSSYCNISELRKYIKSSEAIDRNAIKRFFGLDPKDLREFTENYKGEHIYNHEFKIRVLKQLFHQSTKDICKYLSVFHLVILPTGLHNIEAQFTNIERKEMRMMLKYLAAIERFQKNLIKTYLDYRNCVQQLHITNRKNWPLYPKDFSKIRKLHNDIITLFNREQNRIQEAQHKEKQEKYLKDFYKEARSLEMSDNTYSIIACKNLMELVTEGRKLEHCVGSYISSVSEGREYILFLRKKEDINTPYFTIDVTPDRKVRQIHGFKNCNITEEIKPFINKWAEIFKLDISNCSGIYNHL